jgi:hypothetical protein
MSPTMASDSDRRSSYRVIYPDRERPNVLIAGARHPVLDCSEAGLRYAHAAGQPPELGSAVEGSIHFRAGAVVQVVGAVVRVHDGEVGLALGAKRIPFAVILREQQYLRARFLELD